MSRNVEPEETRPVIAYMAIGMLLVWIPMAALLITAAKTTLEGIAMVAILTVMGMLLGLFAVWSDGRAHRDESDGSD
jgi:hypothetical protein